MTSKLEKQESPTRIILMAALMEVPFLVGGIGAYLMTNNLVWLIGGIIAGSAIMVPAILKANAITRRQNASR